VHFLPGDVLRCIVFARRRLITTVPSAKYDARQMTSTHALDWLKTDVAGGKKVFKYNAK
jgi:hypothetical protein